MSARLMAALALVFAAAGPVAAGPRPVEEFSAARLAKSCEGKDGWSEPAPPAHIFGNTWFVGTCGITALLVTTPRGHALIDTGMADAAPAVAANIARLGFRVQDVRWILSSHEHFDHAAGHAQLQKLTGGQVAALGPAAPVLRTGHSTPDDPQHELLEKYPMQPVAVDRVLQDGARIAVGGTTLTAHATPAHSPGSTSWTWTSCEGRMCRTMTYADSATTISADSYRFADHPARVAEARQGIAAIAALPCGILMTPHPAASGMFQRFASGKLNDPAACKAYARSASERFDARLAREAAAK